MQALGQRIVWIEPLILFSIVYAFWFPDANRVWSLVLLVPLVVVRRVTFRHSITHTPLNIVLLLTLILAVVNIFAAPYTRSSAALVMPVLNISTSISWQWVMLARLVMGMAIYFVLVEQARQHGTMRGLVAASAVVALVVALVALSTTQWNNKSDQLRFIINVLPERADVERVLTGLQAVEARVPILRVVTSALDSIKGGFNANEIAGALAWWTPLLAALALYRWQSRALRVAAVAAFVLLMLAVFLGQSRLAVIGVTAGLGMIIMLLIPTGWRRTAALLALAGFIALEAAVVMNVFNPNAAAAMQARDEDSSSRRLDMWISAAAIVRDYPFTGAGLNMYRDGQVRAQYPVPTYETRVLPHAHNELAQVAADMGLPGLALFLAIHAGAAVMMARAWRRGDAAARVVVAGVGAGILAHAVFGMGDAVALWDRFTWVFWWMLGLAGAQYVVAHSGGEAAAGLAESSGGTYTERIPTAPMPARE